MEDYVYEVHVEGQSICKNVTLVEADVYIDVNIVDTNLHIIYKISHIRDSPQDLGLNLCIWFRSTLKRVYI